MERDIREFLRGFSVDELVRREVFAPWGRYGYVLQGRHVASLIRLMREQGVTKLTYAETNWYLSADGTFNNPSSREFKSGLVERLERSGNVFWGQNVHINPHYNRNPGVVRS